MTLKEMKDTVLIPGVDAALLLVAGGAEGRAGPRGFWVEGVITQRAWGRKRRRRDLHQHQRCLTMSKITGGIKPLQLNKGFNTFI